MEKLPSQETLRPEIVIRGATLEEEVSRATYYASHRPDNIQLVLPEGVTADSSPEEISRAATQEYDPAWYQIGLGRAQAALPTIQEAITTLRKYQEAWGFQMLGRHQVVLTRYGTGGSYFTGTGFVAIRTDSQGNFARPNPAAIPIHEITHLCVEHLVQKYKLPFAEKEKLVRGIDLALFPEIFDSDNRVRREITPEMLSNLPAILVEQ